MSKTDQTTIAIKLHKSLWSDFKRACDHGRYVNATEALREFMRDFVARNGIKKQTQNAAD